MKALDRALAAMGIDARRYWLLCELFGQLAERREMMNQLGRDGFTLKVASWMYFGLGGFMCLMFLRTPPSAPAFLGAFALMTGMLLGCTLISEAGNSLVNPTEGVVLAHQPIDGATYTAAKLTHLLRIVAYLAPALNAIPSVAALWLLKTTFWYYPLLHLAATFLVGLLAALFACALFGWLLRFVPAPRLKSVGQIVEALPFLLLMFAGQLWQWLGKSLAVWLPAEGAARRSAAGVLALAAVAVVVFGIRSLSGDYLVRVASIVHGGGGGRVKPRRSRMGDVVERWMGGQPGRAGFAYTARLMRRDWQFRRQLIPLVPLLISPLYHLAKGVRADPFSSTFTMVHAIPHIFGIALFLISIALPHGSDYKGAWVFLLAPAGAFTGFARGVHSLLWVSVIGIPHAILVFPIAWFWGVPHALLFTAYSVAVASLYLGMELRLVDGVPFSKQPITSQGAYYTGLMLGGLMVIGIAVGIQYYVIFRSAATVAVVAAVVAATAWAVTRASLDSFTTAMRFNLGLMSEETGTLYKEINT